MSSSLKLICESIAFGTIEDLPLNVLLEGLQSADDLYFNDEASPLEDHQYDAVRQYAQRIEPTNVYFTGVGSQVRGGKVKLPHTMGSLNQIYQGDYTSWVEKHNIKNEDVVISDKLDGNSAMVVYDQDGKLQIAFSRGDGTNGADITRHICKIHNVPTSVPTALTVRGEVIITPANFEKIKNKVTSQSGRIYKNPRNFVSGRMNASEGQDLVYAHIDFVAYEIVGSGLGKVEQFELLDQHGFKTAQYTVCKAGYINDAELTKLLATRKKVTEYEIDGLVIDVDSVSTRKRINPTKDTLNPEYAVKFKIADASNYAEPMVTGVSWSISKDGYLKPTVQFEPINIVGVTIQNCTGFNANFIKENNIGKGAVVAIVRSGDVIPFLTKVIKPANSPDMPSEEQDAHWTFSAAGTPVDLVLNDVKNNATAKFEQLVDFFASIDVPNLGEGNLRPMFDAGFETPESIIELTQEDLGCLIGSLVIGKKIFTGIREKLTSIPMYVLMGSHPALGRGIGKRKCKKLWEAFAGDMSRCSQVENMVNVEGFDTKSATKVANGYEEFMTFFNRIQKYVTIAEYTAPIQGLMAGMTVVLTGFRDKTIEQMIEQHGGKVGSGVSSKTSLLIAADLNSGSTKVDKANELGVRVISLNDFRASQYFIRS